MLPEFTIFGFLHLFYILPLNNHLIITTSFKQLFDYYIFI